jgi:hypothetical protein
MGEVKIYVFYEISLHDEDVVVSIYEDPEVTVNHKIYHVTENKDEVDLAMHILKTYPFRATRAKTLLGLLLNVVERLRIYEAQRKLDSQEVIDFYEALHRQDFADGVHNPWKYANLGALISAEDIISTSVKLGIIPKSKVIKYLLSSTEYWSYNLSREYPDTI